jgi:hypothetical protein
MPREPFEWAFCLRRHHAKRPPLAKIKPGTPAPAMGRGRGEQTRSSSQKNLVSTKTWETTVPVTGERRDDPSIGFPHICAFTQPSIKPEVV